MNTSGKNPLPAGKKGIYNQPVFLMVSLFLLLLLHPVSEYFPWGGTLIKLGFSLVLFSAGLAICDNRRIFIAACILGLPWLVLAWLGGIVKFPESLTVVRHISLAVFILLVLSTMVLSIIHTEHVTDRTICRAVSAYLMIGIAWSVIYGLVLQFDNSAFGINTATGVKEGQLAGSDLMYMSFCTLTTLGYGDITPVSPLARGLAMLEAAIGPLYLAILIARLVALYTREKIVD